MSVSTRARRTALVGVGALVLALAPMGPAYADPLGLTITSPLAGTLVSGLVTVEVTGDSAGTGTPDEVRLYADGTEVSTALCPGTGVGDVCTTSLVWDSAGSPDGPVELTARMFAVAVVLTSSGAVSVTVSNPVPPAPSVSITSPSAGAELVGSTTVTFSGTTDGAGIPTAVTLFADSAAIGTAACAVVGFDCTASLRWDTTGNTGSRTLTARLAYGAAELVTSLPLVVTLATPAPAVSVTSPGAASIVVGLTTVAVTGSTDPRLSEAPAALVLLVDGTPTASQPCAANPCTAVFAWDATALGGPVSLAARIATTRGVTATSAGVGVTVTNPAPTVVIASPANGAVVSGTAVAIRATAGTDARRTDVPQTVALTVDGVLRATATCAATSHTCTVSLPWRAASFVGGHRIVVTVTTTSGAVAQSVPRTLHAASASRIVFVTPTVVRSGTKVTIRGRVLATTTRTGVKGVAVRVAVAPGVGASSSVTVVTGTGGVFALTFTARTTTTVSAVSTRKPWLSASSGVTIQGASAPMVCRVSTTVLRRAATGRGSCTVAGLPAGTGLALRYVFRGTTRTLAAGRAKGAAIPFSFAFPVRGTYLLRVDLARNRAYAATSSGLLGVVVR